MNYLKRLTASSPYLQETCDKIDQWRLVPSNRQLLSLSDDFPQLLFAPNRASNIADVLGEPFYYPNYEPAVRSLDFVVLDTDGNVGGFFTFLESVRNGFEMCATGIRTYRFDNCSPYRFGKAQREFYDFLTNTYDTINMIFIANTDFSLGKVGINSKAIENETLKSRMATRQAEHGFSQPQTFKHFGAHYGAVYRPYTHYGYDLDNNVRFFCCFEWQGTRAKTKGIKPAPCTVNRSQDMIDMLKKYNIKGY